MTDPASSGGTFFDFEDLGITQHGAIFGGWQAYREPTDDNKPEKMRTFSMRISGSIAFSKSKSKSKSKSRAMSKASTVFRAGDDIVLGAAPWEHLRDLLKTELGAAGKSNPDWEAIKLPAPPNPDLTALEIASLRKKETRLYDLPLRQVEILSQVSSDDLTEIKRCLSIDEYGHPQTIELIGTVLDLTERVGYFFKRRFGRLRPNQVDPSLRPFLGNPPHESYPSNHSFQMFSVAEVMSRVLPENPATAEMFHIAQRVAENREYAGIHYPSDSYGGRELARAFSPWLFTACARQMRAALKEWL